MLAINEEDFNAAKKFKLKDNGEVFYVPGVGVDTAAYIDNGNINELRKSLGLKELDFVCICMGEYAHRYTQEHLT